ERRRIDWNENFAGGIHALCDLEGKRARHQRAWTMEEQIERIGPVATADGIDVTKAARRDQRSPGTAFLQHRIDGDGRAVQELVYGRDIAARDAQRLRRALRRVGWNGQAFRGDDLAILIADEIGEGAADIDADE